MTDASSIPRRRADVAGPAPFVDALGKELSAAGVIPARIAREVTG